MGRVRVVATSAIRPSAPFILMRRQLGSRALTAVAWPAQVIAGIDPKLTLPQAGATPLETRLP